MKRLLLGLGLAGVAVVLFLPIILKTAGAPQAEAARAILFDVRGAHHYKPSTYESSFIPFIGWQLLGVGAGVGTHLARDFAGTRARFNAVVAALMIVVWAGVIGSTSLHSHMASELFVERLAPHTELMMQVMACIAAVSVVIEPAVTRRFSNMSIALVVAGLAVLLMFEGNRHQEQLPHLLYSTVIIVAAVKVLHLVMLEALRFRPTLARYGRYWPGAGLALVIALPLLFIEPLAKDDLGALKSRSTLIRGLDPNEVALDAWLREHTPVDAVILTPPSIEGIRFHAERAIVVDWKAVPIVPTEVLEWYQRLCDVTGRRVRGGGDLRGYDFMDQQRLQMLENKYHVSYVVTWRGRDRGLEGKRVYVSSRFVVLDVRSGGR